MAGGCVLALCLAATAGAEAKRALQCANPAEVTAMQASAVQQELMDAALTCGEEAQTNYNAFQTSFGPELRRSDKTLLQMFRRAMGHTNGDAAYNKFKTDLASKAELRRIHGHADFCAAANLVVAAALAPDRPSLNDFVGGVQVKDVEGPVESCNVEVAVTLQGAMAAPDIVPKPNPLRVAVLTPPAPPPVVTPPVVAPPVSPAPGDTAAGAAPEQTAVPPAKEEPKEEKKSGWFSGLWN
jgi:hypothetical protein